MQKQRSVTSKAKRHWGFRLALWAHISWGKPNALSQRHQGRPMTRPTWSRVPTTSHGRRQLSHLGTTSSSPRQDFSDCSFRWHLDYTLPGSSSPRAKAKMLLNSWSTETVWENNAYYCFILWVFCVFVFALRIIFTIAVTSGSAEHSFSDQDFYFRTIFLEQFYIYNKNENLLFL